MECPNCGFQNPDGFDYCGSCGRRIGESAQAARQNAEKTGGNHVGSSSRSPIRHKELLVRLTDSYSEAGWMMRYFIVWQLIPVFLVLSFEELLRFCRDVRVPFRVGSIWENTSLEEEYVKMRPPVRP